MRTVLFVLVHWTMIGRSTSPRESRHKRVFTAFVSVAIIAQCRTSNLTQGQVHAPTRAVRTSLDVTKPNDVPAAVSETLGADPGLG